MSPTRSWFRATADGGSARGISRRATTRRLARARPYASALAVPQRADDRRTTSALCRTCRCHRAARQAQVVGQTPSSRSPPSLAVTRAGPRYISDRQEQPNRYHPSPAPRSWPRWARRPCAEGDVLLVRRWARTRAGVLGRVTAPPRGAGHVRRHRPPSHAAFLIANSDPTDITRRWHRRAPRHGRPCWAGRPRVPMGTKLGHRNIGTSEHRQRARASALGQEQRPLAAPDMFVATARHHTLHF